MFLQRVFISMLAMLAGAAMALDWRGEMVQGGMVTAQVEPGATVALNGEPVRTTPAGLFVIGFGRDAPAEAELVVTAPDGERRVHSLSIARRDYDIQRIEGVPPHTVNPPAEALPRIREEAAAIRRARQVDSDREDFARGFQWPLVGPVTGVYGSQRFYNGEPRRPHFGVDVAAPRGTPVKAPAAGVVTLTQDDNYFSGGTLIVDHGYGISSTFIHLSKILVDVGDDVQAGDIIAEVGAGGRSSGAHLDWRVNWFGERLDPALLVPPMPQSQAANR